MPKRMLIDSSHPEETRVVVLDGQKVEEFDFEVGDQEAAQRKYLSRESDARGAIAPGGVRGIWRQPPGLPRVLGNPSRLLPDPGRRPAGAAGRTGSRSAPPRRGRIRDRRNRHGRQPGRELLRRRGRRKRRRRSGERRRGFGKRRRARRRSKPLRRRSMPKKITKRFSTTRPDSISRNTTTTIITPNIIMTSMIARNQRRNPK